MMKNHFLKIGSYAKMLGLVGLVLAAFSFAMFQGGFVSWFLFYAFSPFAIYSLFLFFYTLDDFSVNREMNKSEYRAGDNLKATVTFTRKNRFPLLFAMVAEEGIEHVGND